MTVLATIMRCPHCEGSGRRPLERDAGGVTRPVVASLVPAGRTEPCRLCDGRGRIALRPAGEVEQLRGGSLAARPLLGGAA